MADLSTDLRFDPEEGLIDLAEALAALKATAELAGFRIDRHAIANDLQAATFRRLRPGIVRIAASRGGAIAILVRDIP